MKHTWVLMQKSLPGASYFNWVVQMQNISWGWKKMLGTANSLIVIENGQLELHCHQQGWRGLGDKLLQKILTNPDWFARMLEETQLRVQDYFLYFRQFQKNNFSAASNKQLARWLAESTNKRRATHMYGVLGTILEFDHELLSCYLRDYITKQLNITNSLLSANEAFALLTIFTKDTLMRQEEKGMLRLVLEKQVVPTSKMFLRHIQKFCWLPYQYRGPAWDANYFLEVFQSLMRQKIDPKQSLEKFVHERKKIRCEQERLEKSLRFDPYHRRLFRFARELGYVKSWRNDAFFFGYYCSEPLLKEIGKRLGLSFDQVRLFVPGEAEQALSKGSFNADQLNERHRLSCYAILNGRAELLTEKRAKKLIEKIEHCELRPQLVDEFTGTVAVVGKVIGVVKIINQTEDIAKMNKGDILVSNATYPSLVPAMKLAGAIVTDLGGITCHAAIISRELQIPCVVGTKIATQVLSDGDRVEVDATRGVVRKC